jgi:Carbohydrate binding domain
MTEIITDSCFSTFGKDKSKWNILTHQGVKITPTLKDSVLSLDISKALGANWHGELRYSPFPVRTGNIFTVSFSARAKHPLSFSVWLGQQDAPHKSLVPEENHFGEKTLTTKWQAFSHTWHPFLAEEFSRLNFVFGQIDNVVEIKEVKLTQK